jgi:hypothetical protein
MFILNNFSDCFTEPSQKQGGRFSPPSQLLPGQFVEGNNQLSAGIINPTCQFLLKKLV